MGNLEEKLIESIETYKKDRRYGIIKIPTAHFNNEYFWSVVKKLAERVVVLRTEENWVQGVVTWMCFCDAFEEVLLNAIIPEYTVIVHTDRMNRVSRLKFKKVDG